MRSLISVFWYIPPLFVNIAVSPHLPENDTYIAADAPFEGASSHFLVLEACAN